MTLIFTLATYSKVVQVSDRRLTMPDGSLADDEANKAVCVLCKDACFSIAYTGLAKVGRDLVSTDKWLVDYLTSIDAAGEKVIYISEALDKKLHSVLRETPVDNRFKNIIFVLAGYWDGHPFMISISNRDASQLYLMKPHVSQKKANAILIHGWEQAVDRSIHQRFKKLHRKRYFQLSNGEQVAEKLVFLLRASTRTPLAQNRIGRNCMSIVTTLRSDYPKNCNVRAKYHPDKKSPVVYGPHFITYTGTFSSIRIGSEEET